MTQRAHFGPSWPEVTGFGAGPNKQFLQVKPTKISNCGHSCPACQLANTPKSANSVSSSLLFLHCNSPYYIV